MGRHRHLLTAVTVTALAVVPACGEAAGDGAAATTSIAEVPVSDPGDGTAVPDGREIVTADPAGLTDVRSHPWTAAELRDGGRTLLVHFEDGPSACRRLSRVDVGPLGAGLVVTLFTGRVPGTECPDAGVPTVVEVRLASAVASVDAAVDGSGR